MLISFGAVLFISPTHSHACTSPYLRLIVGIER